MFVVNGNKDQVLLKKLDLGRNGNPDFIFDNEANNRLGFDVKFTEPQEIVEYLEFTRTEQSGIRYSLLYEIELTL